MDEPSFNVSANRGPVTPPESDTQNGINEDVNCNNYDEFDLSAQQEMQTPSPVDEEMENQDAIFEEINSNFVPIQESAEEMPYIPSTDEIVETKEDEEDGELDDEKSPSRTERRPKRKRSTRQSTSDEEKPIRKRRQSKSEEKAKLEKLREMKFGTVKTSGQDTRRFNFRETGDSQDKRSTPRLDKCDSTINSPLKQTPVKRERRAHSPDLYRSDKITHPVMNTFREVKTLPLALAIDRVFSINPQDIAVLSKAEMIEVLDVMRELNRKREKLTINRMRLTDEARMICNKEIELMSGLEHLMNADELHFFDQLKQCPPSLDEFAELNPIIDATDVDLSRGTIRLHAVDLLPPSDTPMIGRHDSNWDIFARNVPPQFHGLAPPPIALNEFKQPAQNFISAPPLNLNQPLPNFAPQNLNVPPPSLSQLPPIVLAPSQPILSIDQTQLIQLKKEVQSTQFSQPSTFQPHEVVQASLVDSNVMSTNLIIQQQPVAPTIDLITSESPQQLINTISLTSIPPPNIAIRQPVSSIAPLDLSQPPPNFTSNMPSIETKREQLSPVSAFRNSLKSSFLVGSGSISETQKTASSSSLSFLQQPPPLAGASASPQRFVQGPYPLMSLETTNPFPQQGRHGNSPSFRPSGGRPIKQKKQAGLSASREKSKTEDMRASESPASSISQTVVSTSVTESADRTEMASEPISP